MSAFTSFANFVHGLPAWLNALTGVVAAASAVTALTPTPKDDKALGKAYRFLELLALNVGFAKDK
jgi:hypothetical protein